MDRPRTTFLCSKPIHREGAFSHARHLQDAQDSSTFLTLPPAFSPSTAASACAQAKAAVLSKYSKRGYFQQAVGKAPALQVPLMGEGKTKLLLLQHRNAQGCLAWHLQLSLSLVPCGWWLYLMSPSSHGSTHTWSMPGTWKHHAKLLKMLHCEGTEANSGAESNVLPSSCHPFCSGKAKCNSRSHRTDGVELRSAVAVYG